MLSGAQTAQLSHGCEIASAIKELSSWDGCYCLRRPPSCHGDVIRHQLLSVSALGLSGWWCSAMTNGSVLCPESCQPISTDCSFWVGLDSTFKAAWDSSPPNNAQPISTSSLSLASKLRLLLTSMRSSRLHLSIYHQSAVTLDFSGNRRSIEVIDWFAVDSLPIAFIPCMHWLPDSRMGHKQLLSSHSPLAVIAS